MKQLIFFLGTICLLPAPRAKAQKFDSTVSSGKTYYKVTCNNKNADRNEVALRVGGFEKGTHGMSFVAGGKVTGAAIDDLNGDGFSDLLVIVFSGPAHEFGTIYAFMSKENKELIPLVLPDPALDGKLNQGYKGYDEFSMVNGTILRKFPIYRPADEKGKPSGGTRVVQYGTLPDDEHVFKFQLLRTYELK